MKKLPYNQILKGKIILLKALVFLFLTCVSVSCVESIAPKDVIEKVHDKKKCDDDPDNPGGTLPPVNPAPNTRIQK